MRSWSPATERLPVWSPTSAPTRPLTSSTSRRRSRRCATAPSSVRPVGSTRAPRWSAPSGTGPAPSPSAHVTTRTCAWSGARSSTAWRTTRGAPTSWPSSTPSPPSQSVRAIEETTVLVTGATDGLGRAVAERLAAEGATVLLHGRDGVKLSSAAHQIRAATGNDRTRTYLADFASLAAIRALANEVEADNHRLHVLVNNAGVGSGKPAGTSRQESEDGLELRFAVNYLAGFVLTLRLLPLLRRSAPARVVNVASAGQYPIDFDDVMLQRSYDGARAYRQSKLAQGMFGCELAARVPPDELTVN